MVNSAVKSAKCAGIAVKTCVFMRILEQQQVFMFSLKI